MAEVNDSQESLESLRAEILRLVGEYSNRAHGAFRTPGKSTTEFVPGKSQVPYAGRVFGEEEVSAAVGSALDFWLTLGPEGERFERNFAEYLGVNHSLLVNSGSSANLIAVSTLTSHKIPRSRRLLPGDEVITVAAGFPTTVAPIIQCGAVPVFLDSDPVTGNARVDCLEEAFRTGVTKAVFMAHTLGNPFDLSTVLEFCRRHEIWLIEDNCDALGCIYSMPLLRAKRLGFDRNSPGIPESGTHIERYTGTWGDLSTQSFYPPHHLTMGEGGAVNIVRSPPLKTYAASFRDWGRDCWCDSGKDNTCKKRFGWQQGELPQGYDHKYIYSHLGYNLKPLDIQAAIGCVQLTRLAAFVEARKRNWWYLRSRLADLEDVLNFSLPTHGRSWSPTGFEWDNTGAKTECSWFGFMLRVQPTAPFGRTELARYLDERRIGNRMLFGGNLVRQPAFLELARERPGSFRVTGPLAGADTLMKEALFVGTYPGLTEEMLDYIACSIREFCRR
jgi:CDP-6-deoxy-D-xylo-4-hexulose-3-dehydrase